MPDDHKKLKIRTFVSLALVVLIIVAGLLYINQQNQELQAKYNQDNLNFQNLQLSLLSEQPDDFTLGASDPKLRLVVYTDTDCQFCERYEPDLIKALLLHKDDISVTYRNFNLPIYPYSRFEHQVLECVGSLTNPHTYQRFQNEQLYPFKATSETDTYKERLETAEPYITPHGKSLADLEACVNDPATTERLADKKSIGQLLGVTSTPTTFVIDQNDEIHKLVGNYRYENLMKALRQFEPSL